MIILISPSKTMKQHHQEDGHSKPIFHEKSLSLLAILKQLSVEELVSFYGCSKTIALENQKRLFDFQENNRAIFSYTGQLFQGLQAMTFSKSEMNYLQEHVRVVSGLYGLVQPLDSIGLYRLPMESKLMGKSLDQFWKPLLVPKLLNHEIINVCSEEYARAFKDESLQVIDIVFLTKDERLPHSMKLKLLRGKFVRELVIHPISNRKQWSFVQVDNYYFQEKLSHPFKFVYQEK